MSCCDYINPFHSNHAGIDDPIEWYEERPAKTGKWFIVHKSIVDEVLQNIGPTEEPINIWDNFFCLHPVGVEYCKNFVAISLSDSDIEKYYDRIRVASYRWEDIKGVGKDGSNYNAPSNYVWFLEWLEQEKHFGWMDFMANIVVNVSGGETIAYMGSLYADFKTISHWMLDPMRLEPALKRGWIFQETAFGAFDAKAIVGILDQQREWALSSLASNDEQASLLSVEDRKKACIKFLKNVTYLSKLLDRRGYFVLAQETSFLSERQYEYYNTIDSYGMFSNVALLVVDRVLGYDESNIETDFFSEVEKYVLEGYKNGYTAMFHFCDLFTDTNDKHYDVVKSTLISLLTNKTWVQAKTVDDLFTKIGDPLLAAYSSLEVTYETDRDNALTQVAKAILSSSYNSKVDHNSFCLQVWQGAANACLQTTGSRGTTVGSSVLAFKKNTPDGKRFLGGLSFSGSLIDGQGRYKTQEGSIYGSGWILSCVCNFSGKFAWDGTRSSFYKRDDVDGSRRYDVFICKPPPGNNFFCGYVACLVDTRNPMYCQFFTDPSPPYFPQPAVEATFS